MQGLCVSNLRRGGYPPACLRLSFRADDIRPCAVVNNVHFILQIISDLTQERTAPLCKGNCQRQLTEGLLKHICTLEINFA